MEIDLSKNWWVYRHIALHDGAVLSITAQAIFTSEKFFWWITGFLQKIIRADEKWLPRYQFSFVSENLFCLKLHFSNIYYVQMWKLSLPPQICYFHFFVCWAIPIVAKTYITKKDKKRNILVNMFLNWTKFIFTSSFFCM